MGSLILPSGGVIYIDAQIAIYSVEMHATYGPSLGPFWDAAADGQFAVVSSELTRLEVMVRPLRHAQAAVVADYQHLFGQTELTLCPVSTGVLDRAARLRADCQALRTPDAIHVATAMNQNCSVFLTNDRRLRSVSGLPITILDDVIAAP